MLLKTNGATDVYSLQLHSMTIVFTSLRASPKWFLNYEVFRRPNRKCFF